MIETKDYSIDEFKLKPKVLENKIKVCLGHLGLSETYFATEYLAKILFFMIINEDDSQEAYQNCLYQIEKEFNVSKASISAVLNRFLKNCAHKEVTEKTQFNLKHNGTLNKIRVIKSYILESLG